MKVSSDDVVGSAGSGATRRAEPATLLPGRDLILAAVRGLPHDDHPLLDAAGELAVLHELRERTPLSEAAALERRRTRLMRAIDRWAILAAPVPYAAADEHCETLGGLVDRMAGHSAQAFGALSGAPDAVYYDEWVRLDDLADSYQRLVDDLCAGVRRLPAHTY
ncbi:hypothetical protein [Nocardia neocaledoniensis]|uniref:hypothetical protein n=1 Tax=Nocardia neocaledoniensis TaxID=236511 RepID=UPI002458569D|nr:hypothetical protein [Nocardia neocaledoniensis]